MRSSTAQDAPASKGLTLASLAALLAIIVLVGRLHDAVTRGSGSLPAGKVVIALTYLALLLGPTGALLRQLWSTTAGKSFLLFTASLFLSVPLSLHRSASLKLSTDFLIGSFPVALVIVLAIRSLDDLERLFKAFIVVVICMGAVIALGFGTVFYGPDGPRTTLSGMYDPNDLALVVATCTAFSIWALRDPALKWRLLGAVGIGLGAYMVARTYSRGGSIALGLLIVTTVLFAGKTLPNWIRLSLVPAAVIGLLLAPAKYRERLSTLGTVSQDYNANAREGRMAIWKRGVGYYAGRPITGVGVGQFSFAEGKYIMAQGTFKAWKWSAPHNMYVEAAAELGTLGLLGLLGSLIPTALWARRVTKNVKEYSERERRAAMTLMLAIVTYMGGAVFLSATLSPMTSVLAAVGIGLPFALRGAVRSRAAVGSPVARAMAMPAPSTATVRMPVAMPGSRIAEGRW